MTQYFINRNSTLNPGFHHEVHTKEHAQRLGIQSAINLGVCFDEIEAVGRGKQYYADADGCATCCPRAHRG